MRFLLTTTLLSLVLAAVGTLPRFHRSEKFYEREFLDWYASHVIPLGDLNGDLDVDWPEQLRFEQEYFESRGVWLLHFYDGRPVRPGTDDAYVRFMRTFHRVPGSSRARTGDHAVVATRIGSGATVPFEELLTFLP